MWDVLYVGCLGSGMFAMCDVQDVGCLGCGMFRMLDVWYVGCFRDVGSLGCGMFGMWNVGDVGCWGSHNEIRNCQYFFYLSHTLVFCNHYFECRIPLSHQNRCIIKMCRYLSYCHQNKKSIKVCICTFSKTCFPLLTKKPPLY